MNAIWIKSTANGPPAGTPAGVRSTPAMMSGGVAALNHRLLADIPPGCDSTDAGGVTARSRWLSEERATPPDTQPTTPSHPGRGASNPPPSDAWTRAPHLTLSVFLLLSLSIFLPTLHASEDFRILTGVAFTDPDSGTPHAYLRLQAADPENLRTLRTAVYAKSGNAASTATYNPVGATGLITSPAIINSLAHGFPRAHFDPVAFEGIIDDLFGEFMPGITLTLGDKLSFVLQLAEMDPDVHSRLLMLGYAEPFMAVCMGLAAVVPMPSSVSTFELRVQAAGGNDPARPFSIVLGRVTVNAGAPPPLPTPSAPIHILDYGVTGHLNAKLRWETTAVVLRETPAIFGFDVFRMTKAFAEAGGYHTTPPTASAITGLLGTAPAEVRRVNIGAILPVESTDPNTPFIVDDNDAGFGLGFSFEDGDQFYYFVAARDLLGRPGPLSPGTLVTICDRMPPESPRRVSVSNVRTYNSTTGVATTRLKIRWEAHANAAETPPDHYRVSRWSSVTDLNNAAADSVAYEASVVSPSIPHIPGQTVYEWIDESAGGPNLADNAGETTWYTVLTVKNTACLGLSGPPSAPGWGVVRDFEGPEAGTTSTILSSTRPAIEFSLLDPIFPTPEIIDEYEGAIADQFHFFDLTVQRVHPGIAGFAVGLAVDIPGIGPQFLHLATVEFTEGANLFTFKRRVASAYFIPAAGVRLWVIANDFAGRVAFAQMPLGLLNSDLIIPVLAEIDLSTIAVNLDDEGDPPPAGIVHDPIGPGGAGSPLNPVRFAVVVPEGAHEYKLYKRLNGGSLIFVTQGTNVDAPGSVEEIEDLEFPPYGGELCYFLQWFGLQGSPSPLIELGCVIVGAKGPLPVPLLERPLAIGTQANPKARLRWFCPPEGIERFKVYVGDSLTAIPVDQSALITGKLPVPPGSGPGPGSAPAPDPGIRLGGITYRPFDTGRVGGDFGNPFEPGVFTVDVDVAPGREYHFYVVAVSAAGDRSARSNIEPFLWTPPVADPLPEIPWPARSLPPVDPAFIPEVSAHHLLNVGTRFNGVGIRVGDVVVEGESSSFLGGVYMIDDTLFDTPTFFPDDQNHRYTLYTSINDETIFPCVVYRYEVEGASNTPVTGNIVQVTPLLTGLMEKTDNGIVELHNPFVDFYWHVVQVGQTEVASIGIFIKDTHPVVSGRSYRYLITRFREDGEIDRIVPTNRVTIEELP